MLTVGMLLMMAVMCAGPNKAILAVKSKFESLRAGTENKHNMLLLTCARAGCLFSQVAYKSP